MANPRIISFGEKFVPINTILVYNMWGLPTTISAGREGGKKFFSIQLSDVESLEQEGVDGHYEYDVTRI